jgi:hypothetical protein
MQPQETLPAGTQANRLSQNFSKSSISGDNTGFSHGAFNSNQPLVGGYSDRHPQRANIASLNTGRLAQHQQNNNDLQTPATGFDMTFTPLLPSQLLLGSPFQPGSPSTFASPQFQNYSALSHQHSNHAHGTQPHVSSPLHNQQSAISPQLFQSLVSPMAVNGATFYGESVLSHPFFNC